MYKSKSTWTPENKALALAIYKRGPRCYRILSKILKLPSKSTLQKVLQNVPFHTGINKILLDKLSECIKKKKRISRICTLSFDEIALTADLTYDSITDAIIGFEDLGSLGRTKLMAKSALVQGLHEKWKQPVAFYFVKTSVKGKDLK